MLLMSHLHPFFVFMQSQVPFPAQTFDYMKVFHSFPQSPEANQCSKYYLQIVCDFPTTYFKIYSS
jgi:hypothetical protein